MRIATFTPAFNRIIARPGCLIGVDARGRRALLPRLGWVLNRDEASLIEKPASNGLAWVLRSWRRTISESNRSWYRQAGQASSR